MNKSLNILILDDDHICNFINTRIAQTSGLFKEIHSLHNGTQAIEFFDRVGNGTETAPDIILLDLNMPVINGFDFMQEFQRFEFPDKNRISIIILTSSDNNVDRERASSMGIKHYLLKPFTLKDLQSVLFPLYANGADQVQVA